MEFSIAIRKVSHHRPEEMTIHAMTFAYLLGEYGFLFFLLLDIPGKYLVPPSESESNNSSDTPDTATLFVPPYSSLAPCTLNVR